MQYLKSFLAFKAVLRMLKVKRMDNNQISDFSLKGEEPEFWTHKSLDDCKYFLVTKTRMQNLNLIIILRIQF